ncbi:nucleotidyltransferase family protein [Thermodesulfobacteriota bacterium]
MPNGRRNEIELLICCARPSLEEEDRVQIKDIARKDMDWGYILETSLRYRVMPLLYRNLKIGDLNSVPEEAMAKLRHSYLINAKRNILLTNELLRILKFLDQKDIKSVPFKGPILANSLYGNVVSRQFVDLDILIPLKDIITARHLVLSQGYQDSIKLDDQQLVKFARANSQNVLVNCNGSVFIGLHWEMSNKYISIDLNFQKLNDHFETTSVEGKTVRNLRSSDLLFYLCLHGTKHRWENLEMICSVAEVIRSHTDMDWNRVMFLATDLRCERAIYLGLLLAQDLYGIDLPDPVMKKVLNDSRLHGIAAEVYKNLFNENKKPYGLSRIFGDLLYHINVKENLSEKIRYCVYVALEPKVADWVAFPLPASLSFLHYVLRPIRLWYKWGTRIPIRGLRRLI